MTEQEIREGLIRGGVQNLKEFGYPTVNKDNILTDFVYKAFFKGMLESEENINKGAAIEKVRLELIEELK